MRPSEDLAVHLQAGGLDLTLCTEGNEPKGWKSAELWRGKLRWVTSTRHAPHRLDPLPLALTQRRCSWRSAALVALERAGIHLGWPTPRRPWRARRRRCWRGWR